ALGIMALETQDPKVYECMLDDIRQAKQRLPDVPYVRYVSCLAHGNAASFYEATKQFEKQRAALAVMKDDAQELEKYPAVNIYVMARVRYFERIRDEDAALAILEKASRREETKTLVTSYAQALYRKGELEDAVKALIQSGPTDRPAQQILL